MTKPKAKIFKDVGGWVVERPGYGFGGPTSHGPYPTQAAALGSLAVGTGAATSSVERARTPEPGVWRRSWNDHRIWPGVIR